MNIGVAHVRPSYNESSTNLADGLNALAAIGCRTAKLWAADTYVIDYPGQVWGGVPTTLTTLAQLAPYAAALARADFDRYYLGTWTFANGINDPWKGSLTQSQADAEYTEVYNFCVHLLSTYSNKDFIIQTAESDWVIINNGGQTSFDPSNVIPPDMIRRARQFYGARVRAVRDARAAVASSSRVFSCLETNRVLDGGVRVHRDILPYVEPDIVSWTSYEAINDWIGGALSQAAVEAAIVTKTTEVVRRVREAMSKTMGLRGERIPFVVGEVGWPENHPLFGGAGYDAGAFLETMVETAEDLGCYGVNLWQLWDNEEYSPGNPRGQAVYLLGDAGNFLTSQGHALVDLL